MRFRPAAAGLACALFLVHHPAFAEVEETLRYTPYRVTPVPGQTLLASLNRQSRIRHDGQLFHGYTESRIEWKLHWIDDAQGSCRLTQLTTQLTVTVTLPRLDGGSAAQQREFLRFQAALREHELGHYAIAKEAAQAVDAALRGLPAAASCDALAAAANREGQRILSVYDAKQKQYDIETGHGRTQGAWLNE